MRRFLVLIGIILLSSPIWQCARRGRPTGGPKDSIPPIMITAEPPFRTTNFKAKKIKIHFDEYIKLKNVAKQLIVSPPLKYNPIITPLGSASKEINIEILDTLKPETTYIFNFGTSVSDNNEGNVLYNFKYVFSTGSYIDSLSLKGTIQDALSNKPDKEVAILLYRVDSTFNDSIIYKGLPNYIANTLDTVVWEVTNIREGKYLLAAMKQKNYDYKFKPKVNKIAFYPELINIPVDSMARFNLSLFKETLDYKLARPSEMSKQHIVFGYEGNAKDLQVDLLSKVPEDFESVEAFEADKDTLNYWFKTKTELDSLQFKVTNKSYKDTTYIDTVTVKLRARKFDSLLVGSNTSKSITLDDNIKMIANQPFKSFDVSKIKILDKDSVEVPFKTTMSKFKKEVIIKFDKKPSNTYRLRMLPKSITTFYQQSKDTINFKVATKKLTDYGSIILKLKNVKSFPLIVEIVNSKAKVIASKYIEKQQEVSFLNLKPSKYFIRAIYDTNKNKKWDTGSFLKKLQPEKVIYLPKAIELRGNWIVPEIFNLDY
jgi:Big-like domain-containing protein